MRYVLDASAAVELSLGTSAAARVVARIDRRAVTLHAPHLLDVEVIQALRRHESSGAIEEVRAVKALQILGELRLHRYAHEPFLPRIWQLRHNATAYDALYLALAEALDAPLLTMDQKLAHVPGSRAEVLCL